MSRLSNSGALKPGFLKTGSKGSAQGNYGLMDLVAGLHWLRENLGAFGGDPERLALLGHGTGAALANFLAVSPMAKGKAFNRFLQSFARTDRHTPCRRSCLRDAPAAKCRVRRDNTNQPMGLRAN